MARGGGFSGGGGFGGGGSFGGGGRGFGGGGSFNRGGSSGGGSRPPTHVHMPPVIFLGGRRYYGGGGGPSGGGGGKSNNTGCLIVFGILLCLLVIFLIVVASSGSNSITKSTVKREPLPKGSVTETGYYTDNMSPKWISNQTKLTAGMKNFYNKTGVQPYLYLTDNVNGSHNPTDDEGIQFAETLYPTLFTDDAHFLLVFFEYGDRTAAWYFCGGDAEMVIDQEAADILHGYLRLYYDYDLSDEEYFSKAFNDAANRIMKVTVSPWVPVLIILGILLILILLFAWWNRRTAQKNLEAEQTEKILKTPLETFGGEAAELAKKYEDKDKDKR